jgi:heavy metal response regulator
MRVLVVDDHKKVADFICKGLNENGFLASNAHDGTTAIYEYREHQFDIVVLDIGLPDIDGWQVLEAIRKQSKQTLVLILSAFDAVEDRVKGLELGADDYLIKPFSFSELLARLKTLSRRSCMASSDSFKIDNLQLDLNKHQVYRGEEKLHLSPKEFLLLALLMRREGEVLSRTVIAEQVWDVNFSYNTNIIDVAVKRLRQKVDLPNEHKLIHTIRGVGYVLEKR